MKRLFVFFACLICVSHVYAADSTVDTTSVEGIQKQILEELSAIKKIQDSTYNQRIRAVEFRNKVKKDLADTIPSDYSIRNCSGTPKLIINCVCCEAFVIT